MQFINGISEITNPLLILAPILLMVLAGFAIGCILSRIRKIKSELLRDFTSGSIILNFLFIFGFSIFGIIGSMAKVFFLYFTISLIPLSILAIFFLYKLFPEFHVTIRHNCKSLSFIAILFGIALFTTLVLYNAVIIYHHPIFLEYDPVNNYLLTSKSILLGNGLHHDYYGDTDIHMRSPPLNNAINAWIIDFFGYSSLRLFPVYFVFISSLYVYRLARRVSNDSFLGWIASATFLITPAILISNSRFSLYPDTSFILFLIASLYFLAQVIAQKETSKKDLLMLMISLAVMTLSKEVGLLLTWSILFVVLYVKFSSGNRKIRIIYSVFAFLPFYLLAINDFRYAGITAYTSLRLIYISLAAITLFYIQSHLTADKKHALGFRNLVYFIPLLVPLIFLTINMLDIHGPYSSIIFSDSLNKSKDAYQTIMGFQSPHALGIWESIEKIPHLEILFTATALGTLFIFFKLSGLITIIREFKINAYYSAIIIMFILQLALWAYLDLGTDINDVRHLSYFAPLFAIIFIVGLRKKTINYKIFYYGIIILSTYYFLFHDMLLTTFNKHFGGLWIYGHRDSSIPVISLEWAALLILILLLIELKESKLSYLFNKIQSQRFSTNNSVILVSVIFVVLFGLNLYILSSSGVVLDTPEKMDLIPITSWENNEFEVIDFLNHNEEGSVLSLRHQAISFFTNRTSFELYDPHTFDSMSSLLQTENATIFKQKISSLGIKYFVFPNENSQGYDKTQRFSKMYNVTNILENDESFKKVILKSHIIYKFMGTSNLNTEPNDSTALNSSKSVTSKGEG